MMASLASKGGLRTLRLQGGEPSPNFDVAFRGYDCNDVDAYVIRLHQMLCDSNARADIASRATTAALRQTFAGALQAFVEAGEKHLSEARAIADHVIELAEQQAAEMLRIADKHAGELRERSETQLQEAEAVRASVLHDAQTDPGLADSRHQLTELQQAITALAACKANMLSELGRLQQHLACAPSCDTGVTDDRGVSHPGGADRRGEGAGTRTAAGPSVYPAPDERRDALQPSHHDNAFALSAFPTFPACLGWSEQESRWVGLTFSQYQAWHARPDLDPVEFISESVAS